MTKLVNLLNTNIISINKMLKSKLHLIYDFDKIIVVDDKLNVVMKKHEVELDLDIDFESQKEFILEVLSNIFTYVDDVEKVYDDMKEGCLTVFYIDDKDNLLNKDITIFYK